MKKRPKYDKTKPKKDKLLDKLFGSKIFIFALLIVVIIYYNDITKVLNVPLWFSILKMGITIFLMLLFLFWRFKLFPEYYKRKYKDKIYVGFTVFTIIVLSFVFQMFLSIPFNFIVKKSAENNPIELYDCRITYFSSIRRGGHYVHYEFLDDCYSVSWSYRNIKKITNAEDRKSIEEKLQKDYVLRLQVEKTFWNIYYVENISLKKISDIDNISH